LVRQGGLQSLPHQGEQRNVSLDRLFENPDNERKTYRNLQGLVATIKGVGILEPLTVEPADNGRYVVVIGNRRLRAARQAGLEKVPVIIQEPDKAATRRRKSIISNVQREDVGPVEMAEGLQALLDEDPQIKNQEALAKIVGKDKHWVSGMLRILTLPPRLQKKVAASELSVTYDSLIRIARHENEEEQEQLIASLLKGATNQEIRDEIERLKGKKSKPSTTTKPKQVFPTTHGFSLIVQSETIDLVAKHETIAGLKEVLDRLEHKK